MNLNIPLVYAIFSFSFLLPETKNARQSFLTIGRYVVLGLPKKNEVIPIVGDDLI
jgi:hypothetical protein